MLCTFAEIGCLHVHIHVCCLYTAPVTQSAPPPVTHSAPPPVTHPSAPQQKPAKPPPPSTAVSVSKMYAGETDWRLTYSENDFFCLMTVLQAVTMLVFLLPCQIKKETTTITDRRY